MILCSSAHIDQRPVQLLACLSAFDDDGFVLTHRDAELPIASNARVTVCILPQRASLAELVTRHVDPWQGLVFVRVSARFVASVTFRHRS